MKKESCITSSILRQAFIQTMSRVYLVTSNGLFPGTATLSSMIHGTDKKKLQNKLYVFLEWFFRTDELLEITLKHFQWIRNYTNRTVRSALACAFADCCEVYPTNGMTPVPAYKSVDFSNIYRAEFIIAEERIEKSKRARRRQGRRQRKQKPVIEQPAQMRYLVKWEGYPWYLSSWENKNNCDAYLTSCCGMGRCPRRRTTPIETTI